MELEDAVPYPQAFVIALSSAAATPGINARLADCHFLSLVKGRAITLLNESDRVFLLPTVILCEETEVVAQLDKCRLTEQALDQI